MTRARIDLGKLGEELALKKIRQLGYQCITRNFRCPLGEIDLIAKDGDCLVFLEIKTRNGRPIAYSKEAIDSRKKRQISKVALTYMKAHHCFDMRSRFDVVAISIINGKPEIEVITNAFDLAYE
ncbi:MAG: YraN family protein [Deltaproteobacteria bacterium]|nr:YraN family protein [Deltaproteobacteria bacterium]